MAVNIPVNSWVSVSETDTYLSNIKNAQIWFALPESAAPGEESKETNLITAFYWIVDDKFLILPEDLLITDDLKRAQMEAVLYLLHYYFEFTESAVNSAIGLKRIERGKSEDEFFNLRNVYKPQNIQKLLKPYYVDSEELADSKESNAIINLRRCN